MFSIPTQYNGLQFRSRLEAKWACFMDLCEWKWDYEPFDLHYYIPDFVVREPREFLLEIKPATSIADCNQYKQKIVDSGWCKPFVVAGLNPSISSAPLPLPVGFEKVWTLACNEVQYSRKEVTRRVVGGTPPRAVALAEALAKTIKVLGGNEPRAVNQITFPTAAVRRIAN